MNLKTIKNKEKKDYKKGYMFLHCTTPASYGKLEHIKPFITNSERNSGFLFMFITLFR